VQGYGNPIIKITLNNSSRASGGNATANASNCCKVAPQQVFTPPHAQRQSRAQVQSGATLPFTGSNLATWACIGIMLLSGGLLLRLFAGEPSSRGRSRF
jgi:hypothetical protein